MSEKKFVSQSNVNLPFPYPMVSANAQKCWPFKEEGFVLIYATLDQADKFVIIKDEAAIFALLKMGFFGFNSNKEMNHFYLIESLTNEERCKTKNFSSNFTLGYYSLNSTDIPMACTKYEHDANIEVLLQSNYKPYLHITDFLFMFFSKVNVNPSPTTLH